MSFKKNKYAIIKKAISKELANFIYKYFLLKRDVAKFYFENKLISPYEKKFGYWFDEQIPNTYSHYSDIVMETLMLECQKIMEKTTELKLYPSYTYARIYKKGDELKRHKDRFSCEISTTMNLGGDDWPIYLSPNKNVGIPDGKKITAASKTKGIEVKLKPGDMLVYRGCELEHWRTKFKGENCGQVFLHYNNKKTLGAEENKFDKRPMLGVIV